MEKLAVLLLLNSTFGAHAAKFPFIHNYFLLIDCGRTGKFTEKYNNQTWFPDSYFIDSGKTKNIATDDNVPQVMTTLRYFPGGDEINCYPLPLINTDKFIFRAGFYYGNHDGKSRPPVFDILLGGQFWATVNSSTSDGPIFHELIYQPKNENISVCVMGRKDDGGGGTPFISSLEATYLNPDVTDNHTVYGMMKNGTAYHLVSRINFGDYDKVIESWSGWDKACEERLNRHWTPQQIPGYTNLRFEATTCVGMAYENCPPNSVMKTAIASSNISQSIYIPVNFPSSITPQSAYIVLYFYQNLNPNGSESLNATRNMDIYVDGVIRGNVKLERYDGISGQVVTLYPVLVQGTANVTISPANRTVLPPLLNGMELFIATELAEQAQNVGFKISCSFMVLFILQILVSVLIIMLA